MWIKAYLHLKEGRPKGRPAVDPLQEVHLGLCHCLVLVFVTFQKEALMEKRVTEDLGWLPWPDGALRTGHGHPGALRLRPKQCPPIWKS